MKHLTRAVRPLHVQAAPVAASAHPGALSRVPSAAAVDLPAPTPGDQVRLQALGSPPSVASVAVPPSLPVFVRRGSVLAVLGRTDRIVSAFVAPMWLRRLTLGNIVLRYQRLVATEPFAVLASASAPSLWPRLVRRATPRSFASLTLDGTADWAVLKRDALQVYAGPALTLSVHAAPQRISRRLAQTLNTLRIPTGLRRTGYTFVSGRGVVALAGHGLVYAARVAADEQLTVARSSIVAISVNGPHDLHNCVAQMPQTQASAGSATSSAGSSARKWTDLKWKDVVPWVRGVWLKLVLAPRWGLGFVRVLGPRTVLLQSGGAQQMWEHTVRGPRLALAPKVSADYLNVVTFDQAHRPEIRSTLDFGEAVRAIEKTK